MLPFSLWEGLDVTWLRSFDLDRFGGKEYAVEAEWGINGKWSRCNSRGCRTSWDTATCRRRARFHTCDSTWRQELMEFSRPL